MFMFTIYSEMKNYSLYTIVPKGRHKVEDMNKSEKGLKCSTRMYFIYNINKYRRV